jgi:hypothetical protein
MEDVSRRLIKDMADCIQANVEGEDPQPDTEATDISAAIERSTPQPRPQQTAAPVSAFGLVWHLIKLRVARLFGSRSA